MQGLFTLLPLALFAAAYFWRGIYMATAVLMAAMLALSALEFLRQRKLAPMHTLSTLLVLVFGGATLALRDPAFIKLKLSVFMALVALAFLLSRWLGEQPLAQRLLSPALPPNMQVARGVWLRLNDIWVLTALVLGAFNWWAATQLTERQWFYCKFVVIAAMMLVTMGQALWLLRAAPPSSPAER